MTSFRTVAVLAVVALLGVITCRGDDDEAYNIYCGSHGDKVTSTEARTAIDDLLSTYPALASTTHNFATDGYNDIGPEYEFTSGGQDWLFFYKPYGCSSLDWCSGSSGGCAYEQLNYLVTECSDGGRFKGGWIESSEFGCDGWTLDFDPV